MHTAASFILVALLPLEEIPTRNDLPVSFRSQTCPSALPRRSALAVLLRMTEKQRGTSPPAARIAHYNAYSSLGKLAASGDPPHDDVQMYYTTDVTRLSSYARVS